MTWPRDFFVASLGAAAILAVDRAIDGRSWSLLYLAAAVVLAWAVYVPKGQG